MVRGPQRPPTGVARMRPCRGAARRPLSPEPGELHIGRSPPDRLCWSSAALPFNQRAARTPGGACLLPGASAVHA